MTPDAIYDILYNLGKQTLKELARKLKVDSTELDNRLASLTMNGYLVFDSRSGKYDLSEQMKDSYRIRGKDEAEGKKTAIKAAEDVREETAQGNEQVFSDNTGNGSRRSQTGNVSRTELHIDSGENNSGGLNAPQANNEQEGEPNQAGQAQEKPKRKPRQKVDQVGKADGKVNAHDPGQRGEPRTGIFEVLVLKFAHSLSYFSFLIASVADLFLSVFFYYSLGYDTVSRLALMLWGVVTVGAKIFAWSYRKYGLGIWCMVLSVFASVSIFLAVVDNQAQQTTKGNAQISVVEQIDQRIVALQADRSALVKRRDSLPPDYVSSVQKLNTDIAAIDVKLDKLYADKLAPTSTGEQYLQEEIRLSAWDVFRQITGIKWDQPENVVAFLFILVLAGLLDYLIFVVTPRQVSFKENGK